MGWQFAIVHLAGFFFFFWIIKIDLFIDSGKILQKEILPISSRNIYKT